MGHGRGRRSQTMGDSVVVERRGTPRQSTNLHNMTDQADDRIPVFFGEPGFMVRVYYYIVPYDVEAYVVRCRFYDIDLAQRWVEWIRGLPRLLVIEVNRSTN